MSGEPEVLPYLDSYINYAKGIILIYDDTRRETY